MFQQRTNLVISDGILPQFETLRARRKDTGLSSNWSVIILLIFHSTKRLRSATSHPTKRSGITRKGEWARLYGGAEYGLTARCTKHFGIVKRSALDW